MTRMFTCPGQSLTKTFISYSALERHCEFGAHMRSMKDKLRNKRAYQFVVLHKKKKILVLKYNLGDQTGKKSSGEDVARQVRRARGQVGKRLFAVVDFLTAQQISSYFPRMAAKKKKVTEAR